MLIHRVGMQAAGPSYEFRLSGRKVSVHELAWQTQGGGWKAVKVLGEALWSFEHHEIEATLEGFPEELIEKTNEAFAGQLRALEPPRQTGLFGPDCCSVCGADKTTYPETIIRDAFGNPMETRGQVWKSPDDPVEWPCHVCDRLVCRRCALTRKDSVAAEYYFHTYCSEACRAAAPPDFAADDEDMR